MHQTVLFISVPLSFSVEVQGLWIVLGKALCWVLCCFGLGLPECEVELGDCQLC